MAQSLLALLGITLPALAIWYLVERTVTRIGFRTFLVFLLVSIAFVSAGLFPGRITVAVDEAARGYPFRGVVGEVLAKNALTNDVSKLFLPWMQTVREELSSGNLPLWNRYSFSGYPLLANGESAPFSPFFLLTLFVPLPKQIVAMAGLKLFVALLFTYMAARRLGATPAASMFAAFGYALATCNIVYLYYSAAATTLLLPFLHYACSSLAAKQTRVNVVLVVAAIWSILAAGHPESAFHAAIATAALVIVEVAVRERSWRRVLRTSALVASVVTLGAVMSAVNWVPVVEQVTKSVRYAEIVAAEKEMSPPMPRLSVWALIHPDAFGSPARGNWSWIVNYSVIASSYCGLLTLALILAALVDPRSSRLVRCFAIVAVASYLVAMNWTALGTLFTAIPPFSLTASDKFRFAAVYAGVLAVALRLTDHERTLRIDAAAVAISSGLALFLAQAKPALVHPALMVIAVLTLATIAVMRAATVRLVPHVAAVVIMADLFAFGVGFNVPTDEKYFRPDLPIVSALRSAAGSDAPFRVLGHEWVLGPNSSALYRLEDVRGSDPMALASYDRFFRTMSIFDRNYGVSRVANTEKHEIDFLNVRFLLSDPGVDLSSDRWRTIYRGADGVLYENTKVSPRFFVPQRLHRETKLERQLSALTDLRTDAIVSGVESRRVAAPRSLWLVQTRSGRFRMTLDSPAPVFIASSQPVAPGWRVEINGTRVPVKVVNGGFIGFDAPAGRSRIVVHYLPRSVTLSILAMILATGIFVVVLRRIPRLPAN